MQASKLAVGLAALALSASAHSAVLLSEGFDSVAALPGAGWALANNSQPIGVTNWFQGNAGVFTAYQGAANSYIAANFNNAAATGGAISNWLMTPVLSLQDGLALDFALRLFGDGYLDTVQVLVSTSGASTNVGSTATSTGDFSLLATFSSNTDTGWQLQNVTLAGIGGPVQGRLAFRYVVDDTTVNGNYVGIDSVSVSSSVPEPGSLALACLALVGALGLRRRG